MPRNRQAAPCLFCDKLPCECSPKKQTKPRAKKVVENKDTTPEKTGTEFPSDSQRKRARFVRKDSKPDQTEGGLSMEPEAVAIRNLATAGLLHSDELKRFTSVLNPQDPELHKQLRKWRGRNGKT